MDISAETEEVWKVADFWLAGIVGGLLLFYLIYALLKPEEF